MGGSEKMRMQTWRWTELLQMLEVTTNGRHRGSQALDEVCHGLVDMFLWQLFPDGLQSDFQPINHLGLQLELMVLFPSWFPRRQSTGFKSGEFGSHYMTNSTVFV